MDLELFSRGGLAVLDAIEAMGYNTLESPSLHRYGCARAPCWAARSLARVGAALSSSAPAQRAKRMPEASGAERVLRRESGREVDSVAASYAECRRVARAAASNFYYAFYMLPRPKRDALCALYAFMRLVDDVSDAPATESAAFTRRPLRPRERCCGKHTAAGYSEKAALARWRALLDHAVAGDTSAHPILPAFADTIRRYRIPPRYFHDLISGAEMDLTETRYATFERLREYCYRVAGTVGLTCLHVFGFDDPHAPELAERLGIAFQLTNILRDVGADLAMGRVYLPAEDLARFGCSVEELRAAWSLRVGARIAALRSGTRLGILRRGRPADSVDRPRQPRRAVGACAHLQHACSRASKTAILTSFRRACA